ncbi:hypothetical protein [Nonomuraea aurantiaca]|uniref:hypothetical protein n=1 Tax=Nonomuraea aurantiaca TaxID=2878562 RepID=UPI001CD9C272|nr:hypothetical protein [Nonomuraea aurantiaca]
MGVMNEDLPDALNRDGGESDVVAERSGADTPKAPRPVPADWPDTDTNPAIPTPEIIAPGTDSAPEADAEADGDAAAGTGADAAAAADGDAGSDAAAAADGEAVPETGTDAKADAEKRAGTGEETGDGNGEKEVRPDAGPTG